MTSVGIAEASHILGLSQDTVRKRVRSGEISATKERAAGGFRWMVTVPETSNNGDSKQSSAKSPIGDSNLVEILKDQVHDLRDQLTVQNQQVNRLTQLLAAKALNDGHRTSWWTFWKR